MENISKQTLTQRIIIMEDVYGSKILNMKGLLTGKLISHMDMAELLELINKAFMMALLKMEITMDMPCSLNKMEIGHINCGKMAISKNLGSDMIICVYLP